MLDFTFESDTTEIFILVKNFDKFAVSGEDGCKKVFFFCGRFLFFGDNGFFSFSSGPRDLSDEKLVGSSAFAVEFLF